VVACGATGSLTENIAAVAVGAQRSLTDNFNVLDMAGAYPAGAFAGKVRVPFFSPQPPTPVLPTSC
jgi:hypothetical protein